MFKLKQTCGACPEAYDVFHNDDYVGTIRLRHGCVAARFAGVCVYSEKTRGDGIFEEDEREHHLNAACKAILCAIRARDAEAGKTPLLYEIVP